MFDDSVAGRISELEADNRCLRRLLDQRDVPGEFRHRLRSTMAMLRTIVRRSAGLRHDMNSYVAHLEDRLDALMRAQAAADERGIVDLHKLLWDELLHYHALQGERVRLDGPDLHLQPRAGLVLALAIHELAVNAVEHGMWGEQGPTIEVGWTVTDERPAPIVVLDWKERAGAMGEPSVPGFGAEVLKRTLFYELGAETELLFERDGFHCTIRFPLAERIGRRA